MISEAKRQSRRLLLPAILIPGSIPVTQKGRPVFSSHKHPAESDSFLRNRHFSHVLHGEAYMQDDIKGSGSPSGICVSSLPVLHISAADPFLFCQISLTLRILYDTPVSYTSTPPARFTYRTTRMVTGNATIS